jgi:hypothetical protein
MAKNKFEPFQPSYNIEQFIISEGMSRPFYNELRATGRGPKEMRFGNWVRISHSERLRWQERMANPDDAATLAIQQAKARMAARGRKAAAVSVASAKHISATRRQAKHR